MKKSVCFVDDDKDEVRRFRECMEERYIVGAGTTLDEALEELRKRRVRKPDLFVLDLYYGPHTDEKMRTSIAAADEKLSAMEAEIRALLLKAGQSPEAGFTLAEEAHAKHSATPRVFFSRKAFLQDALRAHEKGLPVLEKPDPADSDKGSTQERYDAAFLRHSEQVARSLDRIVNSNTWWARNRQRLEGFSTASFFFLLKIGWDMWRTNAHGAATVVCFASLAALVLAWVAKRL